MEVRLTWKQCSIYETHLLQRLRAYAKFYKNEISQGYVRLSDNSQIQQQ